MAATPPIAQALSPVAFVERSAEVFVDQPAIIHGARRHTWAQCHDRGARGLVNRVAEPAVPWPAAGWTPPR